MNNNNNTLSSLLDLNGERFIVDESLGVWVKFEARKVPLSIRKTGVRYSLTLHNKQGKRILGFDNAHEIEYGSKNMVAPKRTFEHWHYDAKDTGTPYKFVNAGKLLEDFWIEVDKRLNMLKEET